MRMSHIDMWHAQLYSIFPHYLTNGTNLGKKIIEYKTCAFISPTKFLILSRIQRDIIVNLQRSSNKLPVILVRF